MNAVRAAAAFLIVASLTLTACRSSAERRFPDVIPLGEGEMFVSLRNHALARGANRVSFSLFDESEQPITDARVQAAFYELRDHDELFASEAGARFIPLQLSFVDESSDRQTVDAGEDGVYVVNVDFASAGNWGMELTGSRHGERFAPVRFRFTVREASPEPAIGAPAPRSRQPTVADVAAIETIDSSFPPRPYMHDTTIADALDRGRPSVVAFATPAFCESRTCAPIMETVMDPLYQRYRDRATFIHVEPYDLRDLREGIGRTPVQATLDWNLETEPWIFVVDDEGRIAAKFEGIAALDEVESALLAVLH